MLSLTTSCGCLLGQAWAQMIASTVNKTLKAGLGIPGLKSILDAA
jgi:hypothetical protein